MNDLERGYVAGLFEGEGSVSQRSTHQPYLQVAMTDLGPLRELYRICGGKLYGPYVRERPNCKPVYHWRLNGWEAVEWLYGQIGDLLSTRRGERFDEILASKPDLTGSGCRHRARTHCPHGHPYNALNTYRDQLGHRHCKACGKSRDAARARRRHRVQDA